MSCSNPERFRIYAQGLGLSEAQVDVVIHDLFRVLEPFVDAAFGQHPVQLAQAESTLLSSRTQSEHAMIEPEIQEHETTKPAGPSGGGG